MGRTPALARDRAPVVVMGDVGMHLERTPFYEKELSLRFARSYGPGRYERAYEEWGIDYPPGQVRWTEGRNLEAVLDLLASGRLAVADLITHRFPIDKAPDAYELIERREEPCVGVVLTYSSSGSSGPENVFDFDDHATGEHARGRHRGRSQGAGIVLARVPARIGDFGHPPAHQAGGAPCRLPSMNVTRSFSGTKRPWAVSGRPS
ncbi:MAG TPA: hypothetical protein VM142_01085 [Acidimicrobiales bacterium]|nr:hypothetical protein [Acidimicrobiales bacterium]